MTLTVGLTYDLRDDYLAEGFSSEEVAEFDSRATIDALDAAIASLGYRTDRIGNAKALCRRLLAGDRWDLVFNIAEGLHGRSREAQVPAILELFDVPYTLSDPLVCALTLDKALTKTLVRAAGLHTPPFLLVHSLADLHDLALSFPLFAKPVAEGTGKGIDARSRIDSPADLRTVCRDLLDRFHQPVLVEEFLPGREFTVGILGSASRARVLGTLELEVTSPGERQVYSYQMKEQCERFVRYFPPAHDDLCRAVETLALRSYLALSCRDAARVDLRLDRAHLPAFIEINPLPGLHPTHSDLPMIATSVGMSYTDLIAAIIHSALARTASP